jgi:hypothetical protein
MRSKIFSILVILGLFLIPFITAEEIVWGSTSVEIITSKGDIGINWFTKPGLNGMTLGIILIVAIAFILVALKVKRIIKKKRGSKKAIRKKRR